MTTDLAPMMSTGKDDWRTPANILAAVRKTAEVGLDPCAGTHTRIGAANWTTRGLDRMWTRAPGVVFVNPPYSNIKAWATKMVSEAETYGCPIITLIPARTDTAAFQKLARVARATCWLKGRLRFIDPEGEHHAHCAPFPSVAMLLGPRKFRFVSAFKSLGFMTGAVL